MYKTSLVTLVSFFILAMLCCEPALGIGAGGFRNEVVSAKGMGRGSANVAQTDDPAAVHLNPAAIAYLDGSYVTLGYTLESPKAKCTTTGGVEVDMQGQSFFIPHFFLVDDFGLKKFSFGLGATVPYGLGTDWADDSFARYVSTESDVEFNNINPVVAYKVSDSLSVGFGINYMMSDINKYKKVNVTATNASLGFPGVTESDGDFNLKGDDEGWGYDLGIIYKYSEQHTFGVSYKSETDLTYKGTLSMTGLGVGPTAGLFGSSYATNVKSDLTVPQSVAAGYAYKANDKLTLELDVEWTGWSSVVQDFVEFEDEANATRLAVLNADNPSSKDWEDVLSYAIGVDYKATDKLTLRCGYLFEETPVPTSTFDTALPDADRHGITFGLGYGLKDMTMDVSYIALFFEDRTVSNNVGSVSGANIDGKYEQFVNILSIGFTYKY
ncbi:OmpP1/FadL family transporter [Candidatus Omnitrophota bacterium]